MAVKEIIGTDGNDILKGTDGNDIIKGGAGADTIYGGKGNDTITAGATMLTGYKENVIKFAKGDGNDTIILSEGERTIIWLYEEDYNPETGEGTFADSATIKYEISANKKDLIIYFDENKSKGTITLKDFVNNNPASKLFLKVNAHSDNPTDSRWVDLNDTFWPVKAEKNYTGNGLGEIIDASTATKGVTIDGKGGNDYIQGSKYSDVIKGGDGVNTIYGGDGNDTIYGGNDGNYLFGGDGNDVIKGGTLGNVIVGGAGNDTITGGKGYNGIYFVNGDGDDVVNLTKGEQLDITLCESLNIENGAHEYANIDQFGYEYSANKKDLIIYYNKNKENHDEGSITLKNYASKDVTDGRIRIYGKDSAGNEGFVYLNEQIIKTETTKNFTGSWMNDDINASEYQLTDKNGAPIDDPSKKGLTIDGGKGNDKITGTKYSDVIKGGDGENTIYGGAGNDTIYGGNDGNYLFGGDGNDVIKGGTLGNVIVGGDGNDTITGGKGTNIICFVKGDGNDTINLTKGEHLAIRLYESLDIESDTSEYANIEKFGYEYSANKKDLIIYYDKEHPEYGSITLKNYASKDVTDGIKIYGKNSAGNEDFVYLNEQIIETETTKNFTGTWMNDDIDASGYQLYDKKGNEINDSTKKGLTIDGGKGNDKITGTKYSDVIKGGDGDDEITGGAGNDTITGGKGYNKIVYKNGDGKDVINITKGEDLAIALRDVADFNDITFEIAPNKKDLLIYANKDNHDEFITIKNYVTKNVLNSGKFLLGEGEIEHSFDEIKITVETTKNFTGTALNEIINASTATKGVTINAGAGNDEIIGSDYNDVLKGGKGSSDIQGGKGNDTIYGADGENTLNGGEGDDTIIGGDGNDIITGGAGNDVITGGKGENTIIHQTGDGNDIINLTKGEDLTIKLVGPENYAWINMAYDENGKDLLIYPRSSNKDEYITIKNFITNDVTNSIILDINGEKYDLKTGKNLTHPTQSPIYVINYAEKDATGTWMADMLSGYNYQIKDETGSTATDPTLKGLTLDGGAGDDKIMGSKYSDTLIGGDGDDDINATHGGDDKIYGGKGNDTINCGSGNDYVEGGAGDDSIWGGKDNDTIYGNEGDDYIEGGEGNDSIYGGEGNDHLFGNEGDDHIEGGEGNDSIYGGDGSDTIYGQAGDDHIEGREGNDSIYGGDGSDTIYGQAGDDYIEGGKGDDYIFGGEGANHIVYNSGDGDDRIHLTKGEQFTLELKGVNSIDDVEFEVSSDDYIIYVDKNNHSAGSIRLKKFGSGDVTNNATETTEDTSYVKLLINGTEYDLRKKDVTVTENYTGAWFNENIDASSATKGLNINSKGGNDTIIGSDYNDTINGGDGNNYVEGGKGNDLIYGNNDNDTIYGGDGDDTIYGGAGNDSLYGGSGNDIYGVSLAKGKYIEDESGDNDVLNFEEETDSSSNVTKDKLHIVFNVSKDFNKSTDTISMVNILDDTNLDLWKSAPTGDFDGVKIKDNAIETISSSDHYYVTSSDIATLAESVAAWLTENEYQDVNTVLTGENTADIEALIAKFGECNWQTGA